MMNSKSIVIGIIGGLVLLIGYIAYNEVKREKYGYIIISDVYDKFGLKKEYEDKFNKVKNARIHILDSLTLDLKFLATKLDQQAKKSQEDIQLFNNKQQLFMQKKQQFEQDNAELNTKYNTEILTQLNQYVKDYGEKNGYTYIFGNDNNGSLMYALPAKNISETVVDYINKRYKGLSK